MAIIASDPAGDAGMDGVQPKFRDAVKRKRSPVAFLHEHPKHGRDVGFQAITDADRDYGYTETPLIPVASYDALLSIVLRVRGNIVGTNSEPVEKLLHDIDNTLKAESQT